MFGTILGPDTGLERPRFGQFARQIAGIPTAEIELALAEQRRQGGRIGEILCRRGILSDAERLEVLRAQARWVARSLRADVAPARLPYPAYLSVCMPAFNEAGNIRTTLEAAVTMLPELVEDFELVVVDDGSRDGTAAAAQEFADQTGAPLRLVRHPVNRGYGAAVTSALRAASGDLVMFTDGDGQFNLLDLPRFFAAMDRHDVVIGYRFDRAEKGVRKLNAWAWSKLIGLLLKVRVRDLDCAFKLFRRELIDQLQLTSQGAAINAEIMTQCVARRLRICQIPVMHYPCYYGRQTGANLKVIARAFRELPALRRYHTQAVAGGPEGAPLAAGLHPDADQPVRPAPSRATAGERGASAP